MTDQEDGRAQNVRPFCEVVTAVTPSMHEAATNLQEGLRAVLLSPEMAGFRAALDRLQTNPGRTRTEVDQIRGEFLALGAGGGQ